VIPLANHGSKEIGEKKRNKPTPRQMKLVEERAKGKSCSEAAIAAGYSGKNARHSGYQAMQQLRGRVPDLLDRHGLSEEVLIDKYLRPLLTAKETIFFQKDGKVKQMNVAALGIRLSSLRTAFELHGGYAPKDPKEAAQYGVKMRIGSSRSSRRRLCHQCPADEGCNMSRKKKSNSPARRLRRIRLRRRGLRILRSHCCRRACLKSCQRRRLSAKQQ
jgi:hypothetical protein